MDLFFGGWSILVFIFLYVPIFLLVGYSFNNSRLNILWEGFTLKWYSQLWLNAPLIQALKNSLIVAVFTCVFSVVLGTLGAWLLYRYRFPGKRAIQTLIQNPLATKLLGGEIAPGQTIRAIADGDKMKFTTDIAAATEAAR